MNNKIKEVVFAFTPLVIKNILTGKYYPVIYEKDDSKYQIWALRKKD